MSSTSSPTAASSTNLRSDAQLIGLVGLAHAISHFSQLILAPLFPWLKDAFHASYAELGLLSNGHLVEVTRADLRRTASRSFRRSSSCRQPPWSVPTSSSGRTGTLSR